jgi:hypothetical protein
MNVKPEGQGFLAVDRAPGENYSEERVFDEPVIPGVRRWVARRVQAAGFLLRKSIKCSRSPTTDAISGLL